MAKTSLHTVLQIPVTWTLHPSLNGPLPRSGTMANSLTSLGVRTVHQLAALNSCMPPKSSGRAAIKLDAQPSSVLLAQFSE